MDPNSSLVLAILVCRSIEVGVPTHVFGRSSPFSDQLPKLLVDGESTSGLLDLNRCSCPVGDGCAGDQSSAIQAPVRNLVHGRRIRLGWVMPDAESGVCQNRPTLALLKAEDHAESIEIGLHAVFEPGAFWPFRLTRQEILNRHSVTFKLRSGGLGNLDACGACPP